MPRKIHIVAESEILTIYELCLESEAEKRLKKIRDQFIDLRQRRRRPDARLIVKTCVHNPELFPNGPI